MTKPKTLEQLRTEKERAEIEYNDVCKSEKEIDKPLGAPVK